MQLPVAREGCEPLGGDDGGLSRVVGSERRVPVLVRRRADRTGCPADHEDARVVGERSEAAPGLRLDEEELLGPELELLGPELDERATAEDDVQLLVPVRAGAGLVVRPDEDVSRPGRAVGPDAEPGGAERAAEGMPDVVVDLCPRQVGEANVTGSVPVVVLCHVSS